MAFDFLFGKKTMNQDLFNDVSETVVGFLFDNGFIKKPVLLNIRDDRDIFDLLFNNFYNSLKNAHEQNYPTDCLLRTVALMAFGAGIYVILSQIDFKKPVHEYTETEKKQLFADFRRGGDIYELGINKAGIQVGSYEDKMFELLGIKGFQTAYASVGDDIFEAKNLRAFTQVFFNAGVTMLMS